MVAFNCDVCGGKVVSSGKQGWFVCENCGSEYPTEWMKAKYQQGKVIHVEGIATIDNLLLRAQEFYEQMNYKKSKEYCEKVLDLDINNQQAKAIINEIAQKQNKQETITKAFEKIRSLEFIGDLDAIEQELQSAKTIDPENKNLTLWEKQLRQWRCFEIVGSTVLSKYSGDWHHLTIPRFITVIGDGAFEDNQIIESIIIPDSVMIIGKRAFKQCLNMRNITLEGNIIIQDQAFYRCSKLKEITNSTGIKSIGTSAFEGCVSLEGVVNLNEVTEVGQRAFYDCKSIDKIFLGRNAGSENGALLGKDSLATMGNTIIDADFVPPERLVYAGDAVRKKNQLEFEKEHGSPHKKYWIRCGLCQYCGGQFKGIFTKVCSKCGKAKDY